MLHKTLAAKATTTTERGEFTAIAAAYTVDRVNDRIIPGAFKGTIERWRESGKRIPLHWDHKAGPENIIGYVDPARMEERPAEGLYVEGALDLEGSEKAREAWRLMKSGTMALSFGYLTPRERKAAGGINELLELDLFEITVAPHPVNPDTRFLSLKSAEEQREEADRVAREAEEAQIPEVPPAPPEEKALEPDFATELQEVKAQLAETRQLVEDLQKKAEVVAQETKSRATDPLRTRADDIALQYLSDGMSRQKPPTHKSAAKPEPALSLKELKQRCRDQMLAQLSGEGTLS
jgi:HK97 family phage prohead protease